MRMVSDGRGGMGYTLNRSEAAKRREADRRYERNAALFRAQWKAEESARRAEVEEMERAYDDAMKGER